MENNKYPEISLRDIYYVIFRHKWKIILIFLSLTFIVGWFAASRPRFYISEAKLLVQIGPQSSVDPITTMVTISRSQETEINTEIEILTSRDLAEKVVDALGPQFFLGRSTWDKGKRDGQKQGLLTRLDLVETARDERESTINYIQYGLGVHNVEKSNVIQVTFGSSNPEIAHEIVAKVIDFYLEKHISIHRPSGSYQFFQSQSELIRDKLSELEDDLQIIQNTTGISSIQEHKQVLISRISSLEQAAEQTEVELAFSRAKVKSMQKQLKEMPDTETTEAAGIPNSIAVNIRQRLYDLQLEEKELLSKFDENSRVVQLIRRRIRETEALLNTEKPFHTQITKVPSPSYQQIELDLLKEQATVSSLQAKFEVLDRQLSTALTRLEDFNEDQKEMARLLRDIDMNDLSYRKYSENLEQLRIDRALEDVKISNISVVQPATLPANPVPSKKMFILSSGIFFSLICALVFGFISEFVDHSIRNPEQVENYLKLPTFTSIPRLPTCVVCPSAQWIGGYSKGSAFLRRLLLSRTANWLNQTKNFDKLVDKSEIQWSIPEKIRESYTSLKEQILQSMDDSGEYPHVIAITSCVRNEGVSTVAANLGATFAMSGDTKTVLVDTNIEHPMVHQIFQKNLSPGVTDLLTTNLADKDAIQTTPIKNLDIIAAGMPKSKHASTFSFEEFSQQLKILKNRYRSVIIDISAIEEMSLAMGLARLCDGVVFVVESERLRDDVVKRATEMLSRSKANILGVVLNKRRYRIPMWLYRTI